MSAAEVAFWHDYRAAHGFPDDRLEAVGANGAAYIGATWGGKARPAELLFRARTQPPPEVVKAWFDSLTPDRFPAKQ
ncbi:MAG: hypothetical protein V4515_00100 [Chloroflexota bacterium]